jgi:hypothetical protein
MFGSQLKRPNLFRYMDMLPGLLKPDRLIWLWTINWSGSALNACYSIWIKREFDSNEIVHRNVHEAKHDSQRILAAWRIIISPRISKPRASRFISWLSLKWSSEMKHSLPARIDTENEFCWIPATADPAIKRGEEGPAPVYLSQGWELSIAE